MPGQAQHLRLDQQQLHIVRLRMQRRVKVRQRRVDPPGHEMRARAVAQRRRGGRCHRHRLVEPLHRVRIAPGAGERVAQQAQRVGARRRGGQRPRVGIDRGVGVLHVQMDVARG